MTINIIVATIKLQTLSKPAITSSPFTYSDLHLDLRYQYLINNELNRLPEVKDIAVDYDLAAIKNSIINLFTTIPGQKILNPFFGLNLVQFIFEPCDEYTAQLIGQQIQAGITTFEPRVILTKIQVIANPDQQNYQITLVINIPTLNTSGLQIVGTLSQSGFYIN
jgi:phage baseplate assembly protein W